MTTSERIAVFLDFQNVHLVGRGLFAAANSTDASLTPSGLPI
jgi:hypothetical protein